MDIKIKRIYETPSQDDGYRVLVDRVWPRGVSKEKAHLDLWFKEIAPSTELRKWFNHDPSKWEQFRIQYGKELDSIPDIVEKLKKATEKQHLTLLYSAHDEEHNQAVALKEYLDTFSP